MNVAPLTLQPENNRILIIDDNPAIHQDFRKILGPADVTLSNELDAAEASLFGDKAEAEQAANFQIDSAFQGQEGLGKGRARPNEGKRKASSFVAAPCRP